MRPAFGKLAAYLGRYRGPVMEIRMSWTHLPENLRSTFVDMALNDIQAKLAAAEGIDVEFSAVEFNAIIPLQPGPPPRAGLRGFRKTPPKRLLGYHARGRSDLPAGGPTD
jgi:hypothetical protein